MDTNLSEDTGISNDVLEKAQRDINDLLQKGGLDKTDRTQLEVQSYFLMFLINDHKKINKMYPFFVEQKQKLEKQRIWWDRLQWVVIPLVVAGVLTFVYQAAIFYFQIVPIIEQLKTKNL